jgi:hypothetical protein
VLRRIMKRGPIIAFRMRHLNVGDQRRPGVVMREACEKSAS